MTISSSTLQETPVPEVEDEESLSETSKDLCTPATQVTTFSMGDEEAPEIADNTMDESNVVQLRTRGPPMTVSTGDSSDMFTKLSEGQHQMTEETSDTESDKDGVEMVVSQGPLGVPSTTREYIFVVFVGALLSFNTGFVNGSCLTGFVAPSGLRMQVSGFTTPYTLSALGLAMGDFDTFRFQLCLILSFIFGSFIAGFLTPRATTYRIEPSYGPTFLIGAALLGVSSILSALEANEDFIFYLAATSCGVQNGISSTYSSNLIRSSGMTGSSTDIGIFLGQLARGNYANAWKLVVLFVLAVSFYAGGVVSFFATREFTTLSLLFNSALFLLIGLLLVAFLCYELNISFRSAMLGTWQWQRAAEKLQDAFATRDNMDDGNNALTERQIEEIFERVDVDKSGSIDRDELYNALRQTGIKITKRESNFMMKYADKDGDGVLSKREWCDAVQGAYQSNRKSMPSSGQPPNRIASLRSSISRGRSLRSSAASKDSQKESTR